jgi:predicted nucleotidyltransferase
LLSEKSLEFIRGAAMKFGASKVILFGSCKENTEWEAGDIGIALAILALSFVG